MRMYVCVCPSMACLLWFAIVGVSLECSKHVDWSGLSLEGHAVYICMLT